MVSFSFYTIVIILLIHWLADFALQTHDQATKKSTSLSYLTFHVSSYSLVWALASWALYQNFESCLVFAGITFVCHWITDFATSRLSRSFWENKDFHNGFVIVGVDQILHYVQLLITHNIVISRFS